MIIVLFTLVNLMLIYSTMQYKVPSFKHIFVSEIRQRFKYEYRKH